MNEDVMSAIELSSRTRAANLNRMEREAFDGVWGAREAALAEGAVDRPVGVEAPEGEIAVGGGRIRVVGIGVRFRRPAGHEGRRHEPEHLHEEARF